MEDMFKTREDVFRIMDAELSEEERKAVMECDEICNLHFSVGTYIRNRFLYDSDIARIVQPMFDDNNTYVMPDGTRFWLPIGHPDMWWEPIADGYREYLIKSQIQKM